MVVEQSKHGMRKCNIFTLISLLKVLISIKHIILDVSLGMHCPMIIKLDLNFLNKVEIDVFGGQNPVMTGYQVEVIINIL